MSVEKHLIRPPTEKFKFTHIHGLTWEDVRNQPDFPEVWATVASKVMSADALIAHNAPFDRSVLKACCLKYGLPHPDRPFVCTMNMARSVWRIYPSDLSNVCRRLKISLKHHDAGSDAEACARIVIAGLAKGWQFERDEADSV